MPKIRETFQAQDRLDDYAEHNGKAFHVIREMDPVRELNIHDGRRMFEIQTSDGFILNAFESEIYEVNHNSPPGNGL